MSRISELLQPAQSTASFNKPFNHSRDISTTSLNDQTRRLVDQFYSSTATTTTSKDSNLRQHHQLQHVTGTSTPNSSLVQPSSHLRDSPADGRTVSKDCLASPDRVKILVDALNLEKDLSNNGDGKFNNEALVERIGELQDKVMEAVSDVINDTQEKYDSDFKEIQELNSEIKLLENKIKSYILMIDELMKTIEEKFKKFLYEFLNNFLKYLSVLDVLQQKLETQQIRLKANKKKLASLNEKISIIEQKNSKQLKLMKQRNKWVLIITAILSITFVIYSLI